jgi:hypothetical protein
MSLDCIGVCCASNPGLLCDVNILDVVFVKQVAKAKLIKKVPVSYTNLAPHSVFEPFPVWMAVKPNPAFSSEPVPINFLATHLEGFGDCWIVADSGCLIGFNYDESTGEGFE